MNYTQDELKEIQAIHNVKDNELGTRMPTEQEFQAFNATIQELWEKGFVVSKDNFLKLWLAFDANPKIPITRGNILETTKVYRANYDWKSAAELEFRKLSDQIGPDQTELVIKQLGRHGLINTPNTEDLFNNFNLVVRYYLSHGWPISADSFGRVIGTFHASGGSRFTTPNPGTLVYKPTPDQIARQKHWEQTRASESKKSPLEVAKAKAASVAHIMNPDGTRMSDTIMREFYEAHPEALEPEVAAEKNIPLLSPDEAHWEKQTKDYIRSLSGQNLLQQEAEQQFGQPLHGSWRMAYQNLRNWHDRKKAGVWA